MEVSKAHKNFVKSVMREIPLYGKRKKEIEEDLYSNLLDKEIQNPGKELSEYTDSPSSVASEFRENLGLGEVRGFEYESDTKLFNIPLVHINLKPNSIAKGIIAVGPVALGGISIGAVAIGIFSFGAFTFGILAALGAVAFSGIISMGAAAFSIGMSMGAVAMANYYAVGAFAQANIAIGSVAHGTVAIFRESGQGDFLIQLPAVRSDLQMLIQKAYPSLSQFWQNFVLFPF